MEVQISSGELSGCLSISASKSHAQRALALAMICRGTTTLTGLGSSDDERAVLSIAEQVSTKIHIQDNSVEITGRNASEIPQGSYFIHESGLATRMLTPILANSHAQIQLTGTGSILNRPMTFFDAILPLLGVRFQSPEGKLPVMIQGPIAPIDLEVDGSLSSQFITGLIYGFVASPQLGKVTLSLRNAVSLPYIELSLHVLKEFGVELTLENETIKFDGPYSLTPATIQIEGDWSSASYFLVAGAIGVQPITVENLSINSTQADKALLDALTDFGAEITLSDNAVTVTPNKRQEFTFDATHCPDLFPALAVLAAFAPKHSEIRGIHRLTHKESNRAQVIQTEFERFGLPVELDWNQDVMRIFPKPSYQGAQIDSHGDHRIAMSCAIMGCYSKGSTILSQAECVNKSFPEFFDKIAQLGGKIKAYKQA
jgi:3-phosphoshikimate 1-carboxyvinyltransferase